MTFPISLSPQSFLLYSMLVPDVLCMLSRSLLRSKQEEKKESFEIPPVSNHTQLELCLIQIETLRSLTIATSHKELS